MRFRRYDDLRVFDAVARRGSLTAAARELHLSKGAISYRIAQLERALGFALFDRGHRQIELTAKGTELWYAARTAFTSLDSDIARLREEEQSRITIGMSTYFASRWLSPRLMRFMVAHPNTGLLLQPLVDLLDLEARGIDMAIRWGKGNWSDLRVERLLAYPAFPTADAVTAARIGTTGDPSGLTLLHDRDNSEAWRDWYAAAGLPYRPRRDALVVPDPNVRVQAVIDGQGVALNDALVAAELTTGALHTISEVELDAYGYFLVYPDGALDEPSLAAFRDWILGEAERHGTERA